MMPAMPCGYGREWGARMGAEVHRFDLRVYYEDTDLAGIVYYANYLKFIERARSEWVRGLGVDQAALKAREGVVFAVRRVEADYLQPAVFDDILQVQTRLIETTAARLVLEQSIYRGALCLFAAKVVLVCLAATGRPVRLPSDLREKLNES
jgi:acyl-CoA thioester hydrolase